MAIERLQQYGPIFAGALFGAGDLLWGGDLVFFGGRRVAAAGLERGRP